MRTTVDIPDLLGKQIKIRTAQPGRPLKWLVTRALEREIAGASTNKTTPTERVLPIIRSHAAGFLALSPEEVRSLLIREESETHARIFT